MAGVLDIVAPNLFFSADIIFSLFMITGGCCGNVLILEDFLSYKVPIPLHIVFRSSSLGMNIFLGWLFMNKKYSYSHFFSVALVTIGVITSTAFSRKISKTTQNFSPLKQNTVESFDTDFYTWTAGVALLAASVVFASMLGLYQESVYKKYNGNWKESLFYLVILFTIYF
ncbi:UDP-xylose and UDP-N-acetylglucosamine transporter [Smittium culicis]|uniref:UDP-xylose and UDP-N-acetylglucosamine transporter n=1 Tax=Smittium culicis TaxID=133412 RepID=A0A1R1YE05_9FUNG|nr:UDP-xylose and UDP-N-acetylglucosamine transporter [Smittium culicis]